MGKIDRKYMAHLIDASFGGVTANFWRLGKDLEEFNVDLNPDTETKKNILGESSFQHKGYEESASVDTYYANTDDAIFEHLQEIVDQRLTGDDCKTKYLEVHMWEEPDSDGAYPAVAQDCYVVPTSYGGDTSGYQIPFTVNLDGARTEGKYDPDTGTFTPNS